MPAPAPRTPRAQDGFALVEVMVSAMIVVLVTGAVITLLVSTGHSAAQERNRSQAFALAQEDQARLRGMRIAELNLNQSREVTVGGATYTVHSTGVFVENATGDSTSCGSESAADYVRISSEVKWPPYTPDGQMSGRQPVLIQSIVSPLSGSLDPHRGKLEVKVNGPGGEGVQGVGLSGSGPGNFSGSTDESGCAVFANLPEGNYTLTPALGPEFVDKNGRPPGAQQAGVQAQATTTKTLEFGKAGTATVSFTTRPYGGAVVAAKAASIVAQNRIMEFPQVVGTANGRPELSITARLFPYSTPVAIYAGYCDANDPNPNPEGTVPEAVAPEVASVTVPPSGIAAPATIQLPPLNLKVTNGSAALAGATVTVNETGSHNCGSSTPTRTFTTNSLGQLDEPGLPYGTYKVCASASFMTWVQEGSYWDWEYVERLRPHYETKTVEVHSLNPTSSTTISLSANDSEGECST